MLAALKALFEAPEQADAASQQHRLNMAAAALLIETSRADFSQDQIEQDTLERLLSDSLQLSREEVHMLVEQATDRVDESTSLYEFTRLINDHYNPGQKLALVGAMWKVAYADGKLDKYEEHLIRRVAELTYVPHQDYIRSKLDARD